MTIHKGSKMKKYNVDFEFTEYGYVEVEAKNEEEALEKADELNSNGEMIYTNSEAKITDIQEIKNSKE